VTLGAGSVDGGAAGTSGVGSPAIGAGSDAVPKTSLAIEKCCVIATSLQAFKIQSNSFYVYSTCRRLTMLNQGSACHLTGSQAAIITLRYSLRKLESNHSSYLAFCREQTID
jgi:hypothetical protein